ncbi:MAG TPA: PAS domain S-box protein [Verrucomicrobiae bacterium]|nr:PAS domain S-box protein [Verrucomicrobiae bacterium]
MSHPQQTADQLNAAILNWTHELAPHGIFTTDTELRITTWNHWLENYSRLRAEQVLGRPLVEIFPSLTERRLDDYFSDALRGEVKVLSRALHGYLLPFPPSIAQTDFAQMQQSARIAPLLLEGQVCGTITVVEDVTEREWHAATLRASEERFRAVADTVPDIIYTADATGRCDFLNHRFYEVSGVPPHSAFGTGWLQVVHPEDIERVKAAWQRSVQTGEPYHAEFRMRDQAGGFRWFISRAWPVSNEEHRITRWFGASTDVHDLKEAQETLRQRSESLSLAQRAGAAGIWDWRMAEGPAAYVTPEYRELYGLPADTVITFDRWQQLVHEDDRERVAAYMRQFLETGSEFSLEFRISHPSRGLRWLRGAGFLHRDEQGNAVRFTGINFDITDRKRAEEALARAREELQQYAANLEEKVDERTAKLRETITHLESFSYTVAHDLRAPIRAMESYAGILFEELETALNGDQQNMLRNIGRAARHLDALTRDLLSYTKTSTQDVRLEVVDVEHLIESVTAMNPALQSPESVLAIVRPLDRVMAQPTLLSQCLSNLLDNAVKFVAPNVTPRIVIRSERTGGGRVRLWIEDNGIGMDAVAQKRIFGIFERARGSSEYPGTGVGLAIVAKAVERMRGSYGVQSEPGKGSRFWIELSGANA